MPRNIGRNTGLSAHAGLQRARESALAAAARRAAASLAAQGVGGDRRLIHVDDQALGAMRAAFGPKGRPGRRNPITGLEQFAPEERDVAGTHESAPWDGVSPNFSFSDDDLTAAYDVLAGIRPRSQPTQTPIQLAQIPPLLFFEDPPVLLRPPFPTYPKAPTESPGAPYRWRGLPESKPGDPYGNWYNEQTKESLRPNLDHDPPIGPHWDWRAPDRNWYRWFPDGRLEPKRE
jgi:hypothetical protein